MKKIISIILATVMVLSIYAVLPLSASSEEVDYSASAANADIAETGKPSILWPSSSCRTWTTYDGHKGIDIPAASGSDIRAAYSGVVKNKYTCSHNTYPNFPSCCYGHGTGLVILGDDGRYYDYAHMIYGSIPDGINVGSKVTMGQTIGKVGSTGCAQGVHLHFSIYSDINFNNYLGAEPQNQPYIYDTAPATPEFSINEASDITQTDAYISCSNVTNPSRGTMTRVGFQMGTSSGNYTLSGYDDLDNWTSSWMNCNYKMSDLGITLTPGTKYYYRFYLVINGTTYYSEEKTFSTTAPASPVFSVNEASDITQTDAYISCSNVTNPSRGTMTRVGFQMGTSSGNYTLSGYDDLDNWTSSWMNCNYKMSDVGITLTPGTKYYYRFYLVINGTTYYSEEKTFSTTQRNINNATVTLSETSLIFSGTEKTPGVTVVDGSKTLINGTDYTVYYSNNINVGTATVTVYGKGAYTGTVSEVFMISNPPTEDPGSTVTVTDWTGVSNSIKVQVGDIITVTSYLKVPFGKRVNAIDVSEEFNINCEMLELISDIRDQSVLPNLEDAVANSDSNNVWVNQSKASYSQSAIFDTDSSILLQLKYKVVAEGNSNIKVGVKKLATIEENEDYENQVSKNSIVGTDDIKSNTVITILCGFLGDADGDEDVSILDVTVIQRFLAHLSSKSLDENLADVDRDGELSILDATAIQRYLAHISTPAKGIGELIFI